MSARSDIVDWGCLIQRSSLFKTGMGLEPKSRTNGVRKTQVTVSKVTVSMLDAMPFPCPCKSFLMPMRISFSRDGETQDPGRFQTGRRNGIRGNGRGRERKGMDVVFIADSRPVADV